MEISTRQLLAPRPAVPIVPQDKADPAMIREDAERYAFAAIAWTLLNKSRSIKETRWAFTFVRDQLLDPEKHAEPRPFGGRLYVAASEAWQRLDRLHEKQAARKAKSAGTQIIEALTEIRDGLAK